MKTKLTLIRRAALLLLLSALHSPLSTWAQGTAFTYQGRLNDGANPVGGIYDLRFTIYDAVTNGAPQGVTLTNTATAVSNGLFAVTLDFGNQFPGANRWLEIGVRTNGGGSFATLAPRQPLTATPYAIRALNVGTNGLAAGNYANALTLNNPANSFTGNGAGLFGVVASGLDPSVKSNLWQLGGNTVSAGQFLGSTNNEAVEFRVNNQRALRLAYASNPLDGAAPNLVGGHPNNVVSNGVLGGFIGGGGRDSGLNRVGNDFASVLGGAGNTASGYISTAMGSYTTASGVFSTAMGTDTTASGDSSTAMGRDTTASGGYSTAMGFRAKAIHQGAFVWSDSGGADFTSTAANQFSIRAGGGVRLDDGAAPTDLYFGSNARQMINLFNAQYGIGVQTSTTYLRSNARFSWFKLGVHSDTQNDPGAGGSVLMTLTSSSLVVNGAVVTSSDRNRKEAFKPVDARAVLEKVAALPLTEWNYKDDDDRIRHLGPMAQDFKAAFNLGTDDKHIATVDADGVALAAIQGLNEKVESGKQKAENSIKKLEAENAELKQRLDALEKIIRHQKSN